MTHPSEPKPPVPRRRTWTRKVAIAAGAMAVLLALVYGVGTSSLVVRRVVLPKVGQALHAHITASQASVRPFSQILLKDLTVQTFGDTPLLSAAEVRLRYSLWSILGGAIAVEEIFLDSPAFHLMVREDGSSNLDPILQSSGSPEDTPAGKAEDSSAMTLDIGNVTIKNASFRMATQIQGGGRDLVEVTNVQLTVKDLGNGKMGTVQLLGGLFLDQHQAGPETNAFLQAQASASFKIGMSSAGFTPSECKGQAQLEVKRAGGGLADLAGLGLHLDSDLALPEVKELALRLTKGSAQVGRLRVAGGLDPATLEGSLTAEIRSIDHQLLNALGAASGLNFGGTKIDSTNRIELARGGGLLSVLGRLSVAEAGVVWDGAATPVWDMAADYEVVWDQRAQTVELRALQLSGAQNRKSVLSGRLTGPMQLALGTNAGPAQEARLHLAVAGLNLEEWKPVLKDLDPKGTFHLELDVDSKGAGRHLETALTSSLQDVSAQIGQTQLREARFDLALGLQTPDMNTFKLSRCRLTWHQSTNLALRMDAEGSYALDQGKGMANLSVGGINALALRPFLEPALGGRELVAVSLSGTNGIEWGPGGQTSLQSSLRLANLVLKDPAKPKPDPPLEAALLVRASKAQQTLELSETRLSLTPTPRAENELTLTGTIDLTDPNAIRGGLDLSSPGLDLTSYYDAFAALPANTASTEPPPPPETVSSVRLPTEEKEPDPIQLPLKDFVFTSSLGRIFLREVELTDFKLKVLADEGRLVLDPFGFGVEGQPVSLRTDVDLGVPGWRYNIAWSADHVPLPPFVNSFAPQNRDKIKGALVLDTQLQGAGITGPSLQKNHQGHVNLSVTNADISVLGPNLRWLVFAIAIPLRLHELTTSPLNWMDLRLNLGQGKISIPAVDVQAQAYAVNLAAEIPLDVVLTNSPLNNVPIHFLLSRNVAKRSGLLPKDTPPEAPYVPLPDLIHLQGTLGATEVKIDKLLIAKLAAISTLNLKSIVEGTADGVLDTLQLKGVVGSGSTNAVKALDKLGDLFKKDKPAPTNAPASSDPGSTTNAPPKLKLLDIFNRPKN